MSKIIVDAQVLLNMHRMYHGLIEHYYAVTVNLAHPLKEYFQKENKTFDTLYETMNESFLTSVAMHQEASTELESRFLNSDQGVDAIKLPPSAKQGIGLTLALRDYGLLLKDQKKAYRALMRKASSMHHALHEILRGTDVPKNQACVEQLYLVEESLSVLILLMENVFKLFKMIEPYVANRLKKKSGKAFIHGIEFFEFLGQQAASLGFQNSPGFQVNF